MSTSRVYSCNVPENYRKDRKHMLLLVAVFFAAASLTLGYSSLKVIEYAALAITAGLAAVVFCAAAVLALWVWWDVR